VSAWAGLGTSRLAEVAVAAVATSAELVEQKLVDQAEDSLEK